MEIEITDTLIAVFVQSMVAPPKAWQFCSWWFLLSHALCYIIYIYHFLYPNFSAKQAFLSKLHRQEARMSDFLIDSGNQLPGVQICLKMSNSKVLIFSIRLCCLLFINVAITVLGMILITLVSLPIVPRLISKLLWSVSHRSVVMTWGKDHSAPFHFVFQCVLTICEIWKYQCILSLLFFFTASRNHREVFSSPEWLPCLAVHWEGVCFDILLLHNHVGQRTFLSVS